ncbi:hypothetical protein [Hyphobacterium sp.]|uniref:hypothetical protein n=1 Tax=Hyphobacterium sp. TaxID=2004662 RepID=UPI003B51F15D
MVRIDWIWQRALRPVLAFLLAAIAAAASISGVFYGQALIEGDEALTAESLGGFLGLSTVLGLVIGAIIAIPTFALVWIFRWANVPRGWTDTLVAALLAALVIHLMAFGSSGIGHAPGAVNLLFAAGGAIGGFIYWQLAGRPRPPFAFNRPANA